MNEPANSQPPCGIMQPSSKAFARISRNSYRENRAGHAVKKERPQAAVQYA